MFIWYWNKKIFYFPKTCVLKYILTDIWNSEVITYVNKTITKRGPRKNPRVIYILCGGNTYRRVILNWE